MQGMWVPCISTPAFFQPRPSPHAGQRNECFGFRAIFVWLLSSMYQTAIIMVFMLVGCSSIYTDRESGQPYSQWQTGCLMFSTVVITVHFQVVQVTDQWTWLHHLSIWLSQGERQLRIGNASLLDRPVCRLVALLVARLH